MLVLQSVLIKLTSQQPEFCEFFKNTYILQNTSKYVLLKTAETCTAPVLFNKPIYHICLTSLSNGLAKNMRDVMS